MQKKTFEDNSDMIVVTTRSLINFPDFYYDTRWKWYGKEFLFLKWINGVNFQFYISITEMTFRSAQL